MNGILEREKADIGVNLTWSFVGETLYINGTGSMKDFNAYDEPWGLNTSNIKYVVIEEGVTSIGQLAFADCSILESIMIPDSVTSIGNLAFVDCHALKELNFSENVSFLTSKPSLINASRYSVPSWVFKEALETYMMTIL